MASRILRLTLIPAISVPQEDQTMSQEMVISLPGFRPRHLEIIQGMVWEYPITYLQATRDKIVLYADMPSLEIAREVSEGLDAPEDTWMGGDITLDEETRNALNLPQGTEFVPIVESKTIHKKKS